MKKILLASMLAFAMPLASMAQQEEEDTENGVVSLAGRKGFSIQSKKGDFVFKPYLMVQTAGSFNWYDDEGLDKAYNQDNIENSGFSVPYAVLGFTGKAFDKVSFNLSINAAASGAKILQQAWFDVKVVDPFAVKVGKFKTPFTHAFLTTLGGTLMPAMPTSLTAEVIMPYVLNAVTPSMSTGWDLGVEVHGLVGGKFGYEVGVWNGTGASTNLATKTFSDDWHIPSLLYGGRISYMPFGVMPSTQGDPNRLNENKLLVALSGNINVESENESTNDTRAGLEVSWLYKRLYLAGEAYYMHVGFTERQKISESYDYVGGYIQGGYFITKSLQAALRYDFMDRNALDADGFLNMPAVGFNYFFNRLNLKLQAMYQFTGRTGHETQLDRDLDDLGLSMHKGVIQLQYSF
ncbi:MAG: OprO/OprP family phosphate-selective porin [Paludibacteraceae bacterium]|nr:OprO/OprP family phosphate-selective porin [Paludibacteraceae bacterium]